MDPQIDESSSDTKSHGQEMPSGLRVLFVGRAQGWSQLRTGARACHAGMANVVEGGTDCVKGLAVMHLAGQPLVVCYDRARSLRMVPVADL